MIDMNKVFHIFFKWKLTIFFSIAFTLSGCPLTVNLNVSTDKPISLVIDKPIKVKLDADVAVTKLLPIDVAVTKLPPIDVAVTKLPPIKVGVSKTKNNKYLTPGW
jgi:hypothetical protein